MHCQHHYLSVFVDVLPLLQSTYVTPLTPLVSETPSAADDVMDEEEHLASIISYSIPFTVR
jgi:hypothetical protein